MKWVRLTKDRAESKDGTLQVRRAFALTGWEVWGKRDTGGWVRLSLTTRPTRKIAARDAERVATRLFARLSPA